MASNIVLVTGGREAVLWLFSDAASYTTGALLDVSGGR